MTVPQPNLEPQPSAEPLRLALRRTHRSVLGLLAVCAVVILAGGTSGEEPPPDRVMTVGAVVLALLGIMLRRASSSPRIQPRSALILAVAALLTCGGLGLLAVLLAWTEGASETALIYTLAGFIFALRPPQLPS
jgi:drug/metabolite transporter (DMT)-like permease